MGVEVRPVGVGVRVGVAEERVGLVTGVESLSHREEEEGPAEGVGEAAELLELTD